MYNTEIFDRNMDYVYHCFSAPETIFFDYLTLEKTTFILPPNANPYLGDYIRVTDVGTGETVYTGIISGVSRQGTVSIEAEPLQSIFNADVFFDRALLESETLEDFIKGIIVQQYQNNTDELQNTPFITVSTTSSTTGAKLNLKDNVHNLYEIITKAFEQYGVIVSASLSLSPKALAVTIGKATATKRVIEGDSNAILSSNYVLQDTYKTLNKTTVVNKNDETQAATFYLDTDGSVTQTPAERITPVFFSYQYIEYQSSEDRTFLEAAQEAAESTLTPQEFNNLIELTAKNDSKIVPVSSIQIGDVVTVRHNGEAYDTVLTGYERSEKTTKLIFGSVRIDITKILRMERRALSD